VGSIRPVVLVVYCQLLVLKHGLLQLVLGFYQGLLKLIEVRSLFIEP